MICLSISRSTEIEKGRIGGTGGREKGETSRTGRERGRGRGRETERERGEERRGRGGGETRRN